MTIDFPLLLAVVIGLVEVVKKVGLADKFAPVVSILCGMLLTGGFALVNHTDGFSALITGLVIGLSAVGLYSSVKNTTQGIQDL